MNRPDSDFSSGISAENESEFSFLRHPSSTFVGVAKVKRNRINPWLSAGRSGDLVEVRNEGFFTQHEYFFVFNERHFVALR